jgi:hypothetical protein
MKLRSSAFFPSPFEARRFRAEHLRVTDRWTLALLRLPTILPKWRRGAPTFGSGRVAYQPELRKIEWSGLAKLQTF